MPSIEEAQMRLTQAMDRLERAVAGKAENTEAIKSALLAAKRESEALKDVVHLVSQRLDGAISRVDKLLDEGRHGQS